jgi:hypothetical protein
MSTPHSDLEEAVRQAAAQQGTEEIAKMLINLVGADAAKTLVAKTKLSGIADHFAHVLREHSAATLTVSNWAAIDAFRLKPGTPDNAPSLIFEDLLAEVNAAIDARSEARLIEALLLLWKAVKRD